MVIDSTLFGPCRLSVDATEPDEFADGYLVIEEASLNIYSQQAITVSGTPTDYFAMVPWGSVVIENVGTIRDRGLGSLDLEVFDVGAKISSDSVSIEYGGMKITATPDFTGTSIGANLKKLGEDWNPLGGFDIGIQLEQEPTIKAKLGLTIEGTASLVDDDPLCVPIGKEIGLLASAATGATGGLWGTVAAFQSSVPQARLDIYFKAEFCVGLKVDITGKLGLEASFEYNGGKTLTSFTFQQEGWFGIPRHGFEKTLPPPPTYDGDLRFDPLDIKLEIEGEMGIKFSVKPKVSTLLSAGIEVPVNLVPSITIQTPTPLDPIEEEVLNGFFLRPLSSKMKQDCATCHHFESALSVKSNIDFVAKASIGDLLSKDKKEHKFKYSVFEDPELRLALTCGQVKAEMTCGDMCCSPGRVCSEESSVCVECNSSSDCKDQSKPYCFSNECMHECTPPCNIHANCVADKGCECHTGFTGNGHVCCSSSVGQVYDSASNTCKDAVVTCNPACHRNAECKEGNVCDCQTGFDGNGYVCCDLTTGQVYDSASNSCKDTVPTCNPACHSKADCKEGNECKCQTGFDGNGYVCCYLAAGQVYDSASNSCKDTIPICNPACHSKADCKEGNECKCQTGFDGNGYVCCDLAAGQVYDSASNSCKDTVPTCNPACHSKADCKEGNECKCQTGFDGNGYVCCYLAAGQVYDFASNTCKDSSKKCFASKEELSEAVSVYLTDNSKDTDVARTYGHPINSWCVKNVEDFSGLFADTNFNEDIGDWDMSKAQILSTMFWHNKEFNQDIGRWNTANVIGLGWMFFGASKFNQDLPWDTSKVIDMAGVFSAATSFDGDVSSWSTGSVTNMYGTFNDAKAFQGDLSNWDVSSVTEMHYLFRYSNFNGDISRWDVRKVTKFDQMFRGSAFNGDISGWNVESGINFANMFDGASSFRQNLCPWGEHLGNNVASSTWISFSSAFLETQCPQQQEPNLNLASPSPLCFSCQG